MRILIVGAGIAGLALARALERRGITAEIVERTTVAKRSGTGMYLQANAVRALGELGVGSLVTARANPIMHQRILDHRGRRLADIDLARVWDGVGECVALHRTDLHAVLRAAAARVPIRESTPVTGLQAGRTRTRVTFGDGTCESYDLVVGADGIHSTVRRLALGASSVRYMGQLSWRFVAHGFHGISDWTVRLGPGRSFLTVALGGGAVYCYADVNAADPTGLEGLIRPIAPVGATRMVGAAGPPGPAGAPRATGTPGAVGTGGAVGTPGAVGTGGVAGEAGDWRALFADFAAPVPQLLGQATAAYHARIEEVTAPAWTTRRVVLIGDAAHAASPNMAQGAALAVEDALVLADELTTGRSVEAALAAYERRRTDRVAWVRQQTHRRDRTRALPAAVRNTVLRATAERMFRSHYRPLRARP
jgi:2-polyprenyl-6-methoxyphenol hydroxylase-like FAD-dependent oxidoreductase